MNQDRVEAIQSNSNFKLYRCPHCQKFLMKGNIRWLKMTCPHCQKLIDADENELLAMSDSENNFDEKDGKQDSEQ